MAHETRTPSKRTLDFRSGKPTDADLCNGGEDCRRPTSHPSGECSECRRDA